ncbi:hypothetical protein DCAR_0521662 [Daucus carota subsp. sativus]|uniref:RING-CH-type domain-containing protein n=1 Tax=Daucus carota subsp. sativus TaxID=79200 RepID=A0A161XV87_DAUCS|nr:PREDICTED: uncharacterized protein LOC108222359 [Daucus carota subsp. sativus]WOH02273.1 hypothetical protein DCAR_0521662 [Daucus carota subsp. sativus]
MSQDSASLHFSESDESRSSGSDEGSLETDGSFRLCLRNEGNVELDLESGEVKMAVKNTGKINCNEILEERECRICHLSLMESCCGAAIELKCECKGDLAAAHQHCADTWFNIRGNRSCEICGAIARYVSKEDKRKDEVNDSGGGVAEVTIGPEEIQYETRRNNRGRRIMNFLLSCMILGFVISWLFHFHVLP